MTADLLNLPGARKLGHGAIWALVFGCAIGLGSAHAQSSGDDAQAPRNLETITNPGTTPHVGDRAPDLQGTVDVIESPNAVHAAAKPAAPANAPVQSAPVGAPTPLTPPPATMVTAIPQLGSDASPDAPAAEDSAPPKLIPELETDSPVTPPPKPKLVAKPKPHPAQDLLMARERHREAPPSLADNTTADLATPAPTPAPAPAPTTAPNAVGSTDSGPKIEAPLPNLSAEPPSQPQPASPNVTTTLPSDAKDSFGWSDFVAEVRDVIADNMPDWARDMSASTGLFLLIGLGMLFGLGSAIYRHSHHRYE